jgi:hypothetical protein
MTLMCPLIALVAFVVIVNTNEIDQVQFDAVVNIIQTSGLTRERESEKNLTTDGTLLCAGCDAPFCVRFNESTACDNATVEIVRCQGPNITEM